MPAVEAGAILQPLYIDVPDENDSYFKCVLDNAVYNFRFTWNEFGQFWKLGVYKSTGEPILQGIKLVPNITLNATFSTYDLPKGALIVRTRKAKQKIGRKDFVNGTAKMAYVSIKEVLERL